ncbi:MAG: cysteine desulfurase family protein [Bacilli bacterium]|nr:cysteine desulfurase family protein [Bacilli bacterium]
MVYLDYAAATPIDNEVLDTYYEISKKYYANPNSSHKMGLEAKELIKECTNNIANTLNVLPEEIIYTSGATESNNLVIKGICERYKNRGKHILISALEHNSIVSAVTSMSEKGFEVEVIPVTKEGIIDIEALKDMLRKDTILVSICTVDSEIGLKQPLNEISKVLKEYPNTIFHTDASQAVGKVDIDYSLVDLATITPHKFYGPTGIGILVKKKNIDLKPQIEGGKSTTIYRSGTPSLPLIAASSKAISLAINNQNNRNNHIKELSNIVKDTLSKYNNVYINNTNDSIPHTINFSIKGIPALEVQRKLEEHNIYLSTKTSCCPIETPSKLVYALTKDKSLSSSSLRLSISHLTTKEEIDIFLQAFNSIYKEYEENGKI